MDSKLSGNKINHGAGETSGIITKIVLIISNHFHNFTNTNFLTNIKTMNQEQQFDASGATFIMKSSRGGNRPNAGRKPSGIKKKPITLYLDERMIAGDNRIQLRNILYDYIQTNIQINEII
jgi:hypothetical protein